MAQRKLAVDVLHHDHGAVDDDAEVDSADGEQIGRAVVGVQHDEREEQRQRNGERDDDRRAEADQEEDQDDQHQHHAAQKIGLDGVGSELHQLATIVIGMDLDVGRQDGAIEFVGLGLDRLEHVLRLLAAQHEDDAFDRVIVLLIAELAEARRVADLDRADVLHANGHAIIGADNNVTDVFGVAHQAEAAHVIELAALRVESAAGVGVVGGERVNDLRNGEVIAVKARGIEQHLILHDRAAEAGVVGDAVHRAIGALDDPVLEGLQLLRAAVGALDNVAIDEAAGTEERRH